MCFMSFGTKLTRKDLHYWMYYPFNFGKGPFGPVGWLGHRMLIYYCKASEANEQMYLIGRSVSGPMLI